jgi:hypothetical protein
VGEDFVRCHSPVPELKLVICQMNNKNSPIVSSRRYQRRRRQPAKLAASGRNEKLTFKIYSTNVQRSQPLFSFIALFLISHLKDYSGEGRQDMTNTSIKEKISVIITDHLEILSLGCLVELSAVRC